MQRSKWLCQNAKRKQQKIIVNYGIEYVKELADGLEELLSGKYTLSSQLSIHGNTAYKKKALLMGEPWATLSHNHNLVNLI